MGSTVISTVTLVTDTLQDNQAGVTSWSLTRVDTVVTCTIIFNHWRFSRGHLEFDSRKIIAHSASLPGGGDHNVVPWSWVETLSATGLWWHNIITL